MRREGRRRVPLPSPGAGGKPSLPTYLLAFTSPRAQKPAPSRPPPMCTPGTLPEPCGSLELSGSCLRAECFHAKTQQRKTQVARGALPDSPAASAVRRGEGLAQSKAHRCGQLPAQQGLVPTPAPRGVARLSPAPPRGPLHGHALCLVPLHSPFHVCDQAVLDRPLPGPTPRPSYFLCPPPRAPSPERHLLTSEPSFTLVSSATCSVGSSSLQVSLCPCTRWV